MNTQRNYWHKTQLKITKPFPWILWIKMPTENYTAKGFFFFFLFTLWHFFSIMPVFIFNSAVASFHHAVWYSQRSATLPPRRESRWSCWRTLLCARSFWMSMCWNHTFIYKYDIVWLMFDIQTIICPYHFLNLFIFSTILNCCHRFEKFIVPSGSKSLFPMCTNVRSWSTSPLQIEIKY